MYIQSRTIRAKMPDEIAHGHGRSEFSDADAAEREFMSNATIGCLSFGARSERHTRPSACRAWSRLFKRVTQTVRLFAFGSHNFLRGTKTVREAFSWLPDVVGRSKNE